MGTHDSLPRQAAAAGRSAQTPERQLLHVNSLAQVKARLQCEDPVGENDATASQFEREVHRTPLSPTTQYNRGSFDERGRPASRLYISPQIRDMWGMPKSPIQPVVVQSHAHQVARGSVSQLRTVMRRKCNSYNKTGKRLFIHTLGYSTLHITGNESEIATALVGDQDLQQDPNPQIE